jgi:hypothetical protein
MDSSTTYRVSTSVVALLFTLGWGVPSAQAACMSAGTMGAEHCGGTETQHHCDGEMGAASVVCLTHHASQDARTEQDPSVDAWTTSDGDPFIRSFDLFGQRRAVLQSSSGSAIQRVRRLHARVGVWIE